MQTEQTRFNQLLRENMMKQMEEMKQNQTETEEVQSETFSLSNIKKEEQDIY